MIKDWETRCFLRSDSREKRQLLCRLPQHPYDASVSALFTQAPSFSLSVCRTNFPRSVFYRSREKIQIHRNAAVTTGDGNTSWKSCCSASFLSSLFAVTSYLAVVKVLICSLILVKDYLKIPVLTSLRKTSSQ